MIDIRELKPAILAGRHFIAWSGIPVPDIGLDAFQRLTRFVHHQADQLLGPCVLWRNSFRMQVRRNMHVRRALCGGNKVDLKCVRVFGSNRHRNHRAGVKSFRWRWNRKYTMLIGRHRLTCGRAAQCTTHRSYLCAGDRLALNIDHSAYEPVHGQFYRLLRLLIVRP